MLTSNDTRELSDALRRRCLYHALDFPDVDREARILLTRLPGIDTTLALQIARLMEQLRRQELSKVPGIAETLDWAAAMVGLKISRLEEDRTAVYETLSCVLKTREDRARISREVADRLIGKVA